MSSLSLSTLTWIRQFHGCMSLTPPTSNTSSKRTVYYFQPLGVQTDILYSEILKGQYRENFFSIHAFLNWEQIPILRFFIILVYKKCGASPQRAKSIWGADNYAKSIVDKIHYRNKHYSLQYTSQLFIKKILKSCFSSYLGWSSKNKHLKLQRLQQVYNVHKLSITFITNLVK